MNPFIESTVARPLTRAAAMAPRSGAPVSRKKKCRSAFGLALGALSLAGGVGLAWPVPAQAVDVNAATRPELESVRGIGPKMAQVILEERARGGRFESFDDLAERVKGIGPKKAASLQASGLTLDAGIQAPPMRLAPPAQNGPARSSPASRPVPPSAAPRSSR